MTGETAEGQPVVRLTRLTWGSTGRWAVYGIDAQGCEPLSVEFVTEEEWNAWRETDPLWREAQRAMFGRLLKDPRTRDVVLKINIKAALDKGDIEAAAALARYLSPEAWEQLTRRGDEDSDT
jgi:hypothetical protein